MVSLAQAKAEIDELDAKIKGLKLSYSELRAIEVTANRILTIISRMTGSPDLDFAIRKLKTLIMTIKLAMASIRMIEAATPGIGWLLAIVGTVSTLICMGDLVMETQ